MTILIEEDGPFRRVARSASQAGAVATSRPMRWWRCATGPIGQRPGRREIALEAHAVADRH